MPHICNPSRGSLQRSGPSKIGVLIRDAPAKIGNAITKAKKQRNYAGYWENPDGEMELRIPNTHQKTNFVHKGETSKYL